MSFFRQLLSTADDKPTDHENRPREHRRPAQHALIAACGPRITLSGIRESLYDPDDDDDHYAAKRDEDITSVSKRPSVDVSQNADTVEEILESTRKYLDAEIQAEQSRVDWTPEFKFEKVVRHHRGWDLPQFSSAEELRGVEDTGDLTIPVKKTGMDVDRAMMDRIKVGLGPRPFEIEDLVERLRLGPRPHSGSSDSPYAETYNELLDVLLAWNAQFENDTNLTEELEKLLVVLEERCKLIIRVNDGRLIGPVLENQSHHVISVLRAILPGLRDLEGQDILDQLATVVASLGGTNTALGDQARYSLIETLFREHHSRILLGEEHAVEEGLLKAEMDWAKIQGETAIEKVVIKKTNLKRDMAKQAAKKVQTAIRSVRESAYERVLQELQPLVELQAGQKWAASERANASASTLAQHYIEKDVKIDDLRENCTSILNVPFEKADRYFREARRHSVENHEWVRKLAVVDVPEAERKAIWERRRNDIRTAKIPMEVKTQSTVVQNGVRRIAENMDELDDWLGKTVKALRESYPEHDGLLTRIDQDDWEYQDEIALRDWCAAEEREAAGIERLVVELEGALEDREGGPEKQ